MSLDHNAFPVTIDEAFAVVKRTAAEEARRVNDERLTKEHCTWLAACSAISGVRQLRDHLSEDDPSAEKRDEIRELLAETIEIATAALRENEMAIARLETQPLPFASAA
jgi:hypothetical protein